MTRGGHQIASLTSALLVVAVLGAVAAPVCAQDWKAHGVPLFASASHPSGHQGFVRVINRSNEAGEVLVDAVDAEGVPAPAVTLRIGAGKTVHFNSDDLEDGNPEKGLARGIGSGSGDWRLRLRSELDIEVLAYNRTGDGLLAPLHDLVPVGVVRRPGTGEQSMGQRVAIFNPSINVNQVSHLRIINRGDETAAVTIEGIDDDGESPGTAVELEVAAGASRTVTSQKLESGEGEGLAGMLDDGRGKWQLVVTSDRPVEVMSLMTSPTANRHLTNLSTVPEAGAGATHDVALFAAAVNPDHYQGFVRIINRSGISGEVTIEAYDDVGVAYGPVTLDVGANETVHFNSGDLEEGNPDKGLSEGIGEGEGDWRLSLRSDLELEVLAYNRTHDGLLASLHDLVPYTEVVRPGGEEVKGHDVVIFNPASNVNQVSRLRVINPGAEAAAVVIEGIDDDGESPGEGVTLTVPAGASRMLTSQWLESGEWGGGIDASGRLSHGKGKWRLAVTSEQAIRVMSLLSSPTGHLVNLSTAAPGGVAVPPPVVATHAAIEVTGRSTASVGTPVELGVKGVGASDVAIERFVWVFSDGQTRSGEQVSVRFAEAGVHDVTVSAMSGTDVVAQTTWAVAVFDAASGATPGLPGIPTVFGDVSLDGRFGPEDLDLAEQGVAGDTVLEFEAIAAGDLDLSGALDERDIALMQQALDRGAMLPSALLEEYAYPGGVVAVVSPALVDPDADIEVFVNAVASPKVTRSILGYATFVIPTLSTSQDTEHEVTVEANDVVVEQLRLLIKPAPPLPMRSPSDDVLAYLNELSRLVATQEEAGSAFLEEVGELTENDAAILLSATKAAAIEIDSAIAELSAVLNAEHGERFAELLQTALYANGIQAYRDTAENIAAQSTRSNLSAAPSQPTSNPTAPLSLSIVCDVYVPSICFLKTTNDALVLLIDPTVTALCSIIQLASYFSLNPAVVAAVTKACTGTALALQLTKFLTSYVEHIEMAIALASDKAALKSGEVATISAAVEFSGHQTLCEDSPGGPNFVRDLAKLLVTKSVPLANLNKIIDKAAGKGAFLGILSSALGAVISLSKLDTLFVEVRGKLCDLVSGSEEFASGSSKLLADAREFNLESPNGGLLSLQLDESRNYTGRFELACPVELAGTALVTGKVSVKGKKHMCGVDTFDSVTVACGNVCVTGSGGVVDIPDAGLRAAVEAALGKASGEPIMRTEMTSLTSLAVESRSVRSLIGLECAFNLVRLTLSDNQIVDVSPLSGLTKLRYLSLGENEIADVSPLAELTALSELHLNDNRLTDVSPVSGLTELRYLSLSGNVISDISPLTDLILEELDLARNLITDLSTLADSVTLDWLDLSDNQIRHIAPLRRLTPLVTLNLGNNLIVDVSALSGLTELVSLNLGGNRIEVLSALSGLTSLRHLSLEDNEISDITPLVANRGLDSGDDVNLSDNELSDEACSEQVPVLVQRGVSVASDCEAVCPEDVVAIPDDNLRAVVEGALGKEPGERITPVEMARLTRLMAEGFEIGSLKGLECATGLTDLSFHDNNVSDISALSGLTALRYLILYDNNISDISALSGLTALRYLNLNYNNISDISALSGLTSLRTLSLGENNISDISALSGLTALMVLELSYNNISDTSALSGLTALLTLSFSHNNFSDISALSGLTALEILYFSGNNISDISTLSGLTALNVLDLGRNNISNIYPLALNRGLGASDSVTLAGNPLDRVSCTVHIPALERRGVRVSWWPSC